MNTLASMATDIAALQAHRDFAVAELQDARDRLDEAEAKLELANGAIATLRGDLSDTEFEVDEVEGLAEENQSDIEDLQEEVGTGSCLLPAPTVRLAQRAMVPPFSFSRPFSFTPPSCYRPRAPTTAERGTKLAHFRCGRTGGPRDHQSIERCGRCRRPC